MTAQILIGILASLIAAGILAALGHKNSAPPAPERQQYAFIGGDGTIIQSGDVHVNVVGANDNTSTTEHQDVAILLVIAAALGIAAIMTFLPAVIATIIAIAAATVLALPFAAFRLHGRRPRLALITATVASLSALVLTLEIMRRPFAGRSSTIMDWHRYAVAQPAADIAERQRPAELHRRKLYRRRLHLRRYRRVRADTQCRPRHTEDISSRHIHARRRAGFSAAAHATRPVGGRHHARRDRRLPGRGRALLRHIRRRNRRLRRLSLSGTGLAIHLVMGDRGSGDRPVHAGPADQSQP